VDNCYHNWRGGGGGGGGRGLCIITSMQKSVDSIPLPALIIVNSFLNFSVINV